MYIFSRPRRFGKSLLISHLKSCLKEIKRYLKGLYICDKWE
ncbi:AAA family ATPase [Candidatus Endomicrobiellum agilis]|nr:AAA family ATPase [Endomicrobium sp.]